MAKKDKLEEEVEEMRERATAQAVAEMEPKKKTYRPAIQKSPVHTCVCGNPLARLASEGDDAPFHCILHLTGEPTDVCQTDVPYRDKKTGAVLIRLEPLPSRKED